MDCVQWCLCPTKWKSTDKEATGGMGESFTHRKSPYFSLLPPLCKKKPSPTKTILPCFGRAGGDDRAVELPPPGSGQTLSGLLLGRTAAQAGSLPSLGSLPAPFGSAERSREYCATSDSPAPVLGKCLCSVNSQVPFYLSNTCCNCFKVKIRPSVYSCCCEEGGTCCCTP